MKMIFKIWDAIFKLIMLKVSAKRRNNYLRSKGVKIGQDCKILTVSFSTELYLIEIGDGARIASGTQFITHDGSVNCFPGEVDGGIFGKITLGNNVFIGNNSIILLNTTLGDNCVVGAGSVVRGQFPAGSVIVGNPAKVLMKTSVQKMLFRQSPGLVKTNGLTPDEKDKLVKKHFGIIE
jgi:acetyltransferase-like isoleucine patch superfamily enzyme